MTKVLHYDFRPPWWGHPVANGIAGGVASGGGAYATTEDLLTSGIAGVIGSIVAGGGTHAATRGKVFDKSGHGRTGFPKNDAHVEDGSLVLDGEDDYLRSERGFELAESYLISVAIKWKGVDLGEKPAHVLAWVALWGNRERTVHTPLRR